MTQTTPAERVRVAVVQAAPVAFDLDATLAKVRHFAREAAASGAQLALFPEAFVSAYPRGMDFFTVVGARGKEGREWYRRYWASSIDVPGPATQTLGDIAREHALHLVIGVIEREGGTLYCTALVFAPDGALAGQASQADADGARSGSSGGSATARRFRSSIRRSAELGTAICWENYMPLYRTAHLWQGRRDLLRADRRSRATAGSRACSTSRSKDAASCSRANQFARRSDYPADYPAFRDMADRKWCAGAAVAS